MGKKQEVSLISFRAGKIKAQGRAQVQSRLVNKTQDSCILT